MHLSAIEKSLIERINQYLKEKPNLLMIYPSCNNNKQNCDLSHTYNLIRLFVVPIILPKKQIPYIVKAKEMLLSYSAKYL